MKKIWICAIASFSFVLGCGDDDSGSADPVETETFALNFEGVVGDQALSCDQTYTLGAADTDVSFTELKLYVSEIELLSADGAVPAELVADGVWSNGSTVLLDFEDATGSCANGTPETNTVVNVEVPAGDYTGVRFKVGVPFEENHQDVAVAPSPLNLTSMFWNWNGGYKFVRIDGRAQNGEAEGGFVFHVGSTGCTMPEGSEMVESCANPNRAEIELNGFTPGSSTIQMDVATLFGDADFTPANAASINCQSFPTQDVCSQIFPRMGLGFGDTPAAEQSVFSVQ